MGVARTALAALGLATVTAVCCSAADAERGLVGTWRFVEYTDFRNGNPVHPFGDPPTGILIYTSSGTMSVQIMHNPAPTSLQDLIRPGEDVGQLNERSYVGYFGKYHVDTARSVVVHHVEGGTRLDYVGKDEERAFRWEGERLVLGTSTLRRVLVRVNSTAEKAEQDPKTTR